MSLRHNVALTKCFGQVRKFFEGGAGELWLQMSPGIFLPSLSLLFRFPCYPVASASIFSTRTAQTLYSGILQIGSRAGLVRTFALASMKWKLMKIMPGSTRSVRSTLLTTSPRRETIFASLMILQAQLFRVNWVYFHMPFRHFSVESRGVSRHCSCVVMREISTRSELNRKLLID